MTLATGAYKSNFPPVWELRTDRPAIRPTDQRTDRRGHRKVTLPISFFVTQWAYLHYIQYQNLLHLFFRQSPILMNHSSSTNAAYSHELALPGVQLLSPQESQLSRGNGLTVSAYTLEMNEILPNQAQVR